MWRLVEFEEICEIVQGHKIAKKEICYSLPLGGKGEAFTLDDGTKIGTVSEAGWGGTDITPGDCAEAPSWFLWTAEDVKSGAKSRND